MDVKELSEKYGYHVGTIRMLLCRAEFSAYTDNFGRVTSWDDIAEERLKRIIKLKNMGGQNGYTSRKSV